MKFLQREDVVCAVVNGITTSESVHEMSLYTDLQFNLIWKEHRITDCQPSLALHLRAQGAFLKGLKELSREFWISCVEHKVF